jgi:GNAT superfamily N-acetyltransferase
MTSDTTLDLDRLTERSLTLDDIPQLAEIYRELEQAEPAEEHYSEDEIAEELTGPTIDLQRASYALLDGDTLVAFSAVVAISDSTMWKAMLNGGVRTGWTRRGLGTRVLRRSQEQARAWRAEAAPELPAELTMWLPQQRVSTIALATAEGFQVWRYFFEMRRDLREPVETVAAPPGFTLREYRVGDDDEPVRLARNASFADHWGSLETTPERWRAHMIDATPFRPQHSFVATFDDGPQQGGIAAFVLAEEFEAETEARGYRTGYVALVGTVREARGHGLASALLARQLASMQDGGYAFAELGVDSDSPTGAGRIYQRAGFSQFKRVTAAGKKF